MTIKNRGALSNPAGRFEPHTKESFDDGWERFDDPLPPLSTTLFAEKAKSIITHNDSPDISFNQTINPYRGCEHGCVYCYARPAHAYVNLSPGIDFETKIFYKENAAELLERSFSKKNYTCDPIVIGGNTDPYQPAELKLKITRQLLEVMLRHQHPVILITKNNMIERDIDLLSELAKKNLVKVAISITTLDDELKRCLEPRTSSPRARLRTLRSLNSTNIPTRAFHNLI